MCPKREELTLDPRRTPPLWWQSVIVYRRWRCGRWWERVERGVERVLTSFLHQIGQWSSHKAGEGCLSRWLVRSGGQGWLKPEPMHKASLGASHLKPECFLNVGQGRACRWVRTTTVRRPGGHRGRVQAIRVISCKWDPGTALLKDLMWETSLVVQWLKICFPVQRTQVQSLVGELRSCVCVCVCVCIHIYMHVYRCMLSCVCLFSTLWTVAHLASLSLGFPSQEY